MAEEEIALVNCLDMDHVACGAGLTGILRIDAIRVGSLDRKHLGCKNKFIGRTACCNDLSHKTIRTDSVGPRLPGVIVVEDFPDPLLICFGLNKLGRTEAVASVQERILVGVVAEQVALNVQPGTGALDQYMGVDGGRGHDRLGVDGVLEEFGAGDQLCGLADRGHVAGGEAHSLGGDVEHLVEPAPGGRG